MSTKGRAARNGSGVTNVGRDMGEGERGEATPVVAFCNVAGVGAERGLTDQSSPMCKVC